MKINSSDNKVFAFNKLQKDETILSFDGSGKLGVGAQGGFLSKISSLFEKIKTFMDSPEEKELRQKIERELAKKNFINSQSSYLFEGKLDELIDTREKYDLKNPAAVIDYNRFVRVKEDEPIDKTALTDRAIQALRNQIFAEINGENSYIDYLYTEGKVHDYVDVAEAMHYLYEDITQDEYNEWRDKAEKGLDSLMRRMGKLLGENKDYTPDTLTSVLNYRLYNILKSWTNEAETRKKIERDFADDILGNALYPSSVENFSEFSTALQALGILSPNYQFISKNVAEVDIYQKEYESHSELTKKRELVFEIAKDKELLRDEKFDALLEKDYGKTLNEMIKRLQALKDNSTLSEKNEQIYEGRLKSTLENFSELFILNLYGGDPELRDSANTEWYNNYKTKINEAFLAVSERSLTDFDFHKDPTETYLVDDERAIVIENFKEALKGFDSFFREENGFAKILDSYSSDFKTLKDAYDNVREIVSCEQLYGIFDKEKGEMAKKAFNDLFLQDVYNHNYNEFIFEKLGSDFDKLYKESSKQKNLMAIDKKALEFFEDIKSGLINPEKLNDEIQNRFGKELQEYDKIEWSANPFAATMLQASGFLMQNLSTPYNYDFESFKERIAKAEMELGISNLSNRISLVSMIKEKDPNTKDLLALLSTGYSPEWKKFGEDIFGNKTKIENPYDRAEIVDSRIISGNPGGNPGGAFEQLYPRGAIESLSKLVRFEKEKGLIQGLESGTTTLEEFANKYGDEYQRLLNDARKSLEQNLLAQSKGFETVDQYDKFLSFNLQIDPDSVIKSFKEPIDINPAFIEKVANGEHQKFVEKVIDLVKDQYKGSVDVKALVEEVYNKGAQKVIEEENLDGRTTESRFGKEIDKKIKEVGELSM